MRAFRPLIGFVFCLMLALTGQAMAFARAQAPAEGRVLLCTGHGSFILYVDEEGQPTSPPQLCVDCLHLLLADPAGPTLLASRQPASEPAQTSPIAEPFTRSLFYFYTARAPPLFV